MKNIESKNKQKNESPDKRDKETLKPLEEDATDSLKLGDDKQVSRDLTQLYEKDLKF